jgi:hypothetical protein
MDKIGGIHRGRLGVQLVEKPLWILERAVVDSIESATEAN